jgi:hypothetical protein
MLVDLARTARRGLRRATFACAAAGLELDPALFEGRRVLVVGPARGAGDELRQLAGERFDHVIRMNNGLAVADAGGRAFPRTDILFHNFKEKGPRSAGRLERDMLDRAGLRHLIFTHPTASRAVPLLKARLRVARLGCAARLRIPSPRCYAEFSRSFGAWEPTTGSVAIAFALSGRPERLAVVGFTFFGTGYEPGYNTEIGETDACDWARALGAHNPEADRERVRELLAQAPRSGISLHLGQGVAASLGLVRDGA